MPSFDSVNYSLRVKKNIERKLIADILLSLDKQFKTTGYQYIGMGSMWFSDFMLIHRVLGIKTMWSVERDSPKRAAFNSPYGFINVQEGTAAEYLPKFLDTKLNSIVWLDYDGDLSRGIVKDLKDLAARAKPGDVIMVTANAHHGQVKPVSLGNIGVLSNRIDQFLTEATEETLPENMKADELIPVFKKILKDIEKASIKRSVDERNQRLYELIDKIMPCNFKNIDFSEKNFPKLVSSVLFKSLDSACRSSGRSVSFAPIFNYFYSDGAPMVTIGGMVVDEGCGEKLKNWKQTENPLFAKEEDQISIDVPNLTPREKAQIDSFITSDEKNPSSTDLNLEFDDEAINNYCQFYRHYPIFNEVI